MGYKFDTLAYMCLKDVQIVFFPLFESISYHLSSDQC
jgi:hypothetical protein